MQILEKLQTKQMMLKHLAKIMIVKASNENVRE